MTAVLARHELARAPIETPFVGTFPTFFVGDVVVKLFGPRYDGGRIERQVDLGAVRSLDDLAHLVFGRPR